MGDKLWKQTERAVARRLGGQRTGPTGRTGPDVVTDWASVEVKTRKRLPAWLKDAVAQARATTWGDRLPLVVLHETGQRHDNDLTLLTFKDFVAWFGDPLPSRGTTEEGDGTELGNDPGAPGEPIP